MRKSALHFLLIFIITIPAFWSLFHTGYFSMHDDQHIARLFLLDKAIHQGILFPRWVDRLGFSFGYPLFNFYPPFIYYIAEAFHLIGFPLIWSIKLLVTTGFLAAAVGMFVFAKKKIGALGGLIAGTLYTYFFYHGVLAYVRGAFAEFFALAIIPWVFLTFENVWEQPSKKTAALFGLSFAILVLTHPLIAFPTILFLGLYSFFFLIKKVPQAGRSFLTALGGGVLGLGLSAFFWLPSMIERKYTLLDKVFPTELSSYTIHFICPPQFLSSLWGYGGSVAGCFDGFTFQLGKMHLLLLAAALIGAVIYVSRSKKEDPIIPYFALYTLLAFFSLFMTTEFSTLLWQKISFLQYLQFPWRFLTFAGFFLSIAGAFSIYFATKLSFLRNQKNLLIIATIAIVSVTSLYYSRYFHPQTYILKSDSQLTSFDEIAWRVSRSSFDFLPADIPTKKSDQDTTIPAIVPKDLEKRLYNIFQGNGDVTVTENTMIEKDFTINSTNTKVPMEFWLYTFNFPGWTATLDGNKIPIRSNQTFGLIAVTVPMGIHSLKVSFEDTSIRTIGNVVSGLGVLAVFLLLFGSQLKKVKRRAISWFDKSLDELKR